MLFGGGGRVARLTLVRIKHSPGPHVMRPVGLDAGDQFGIEVLREVPLHLRLQLPCQRELLVDLLLLSVSHRGLVRIHSALRFHV